MDGFGGLLDGPRARGAFALRAVMTPPWSLRICAESRLTLLAIVKGHAWVVTDGGERVRLDVGDVAVTRGPDHYTVADDPASPTSVVIHPGQRCCSPDGESMQERMSLGVRVWGNDPVGSTVMLVGAYESTGDISDRLLRALPALLSLTNEQWDSPLVSLLCDEVEKDLPGQAAVLDRLIDLLLIAVLRAWFTRPEAEAPAWYRSQGDPIVGRALHVMHGNPAHPWTVASLAAEVGVSRAALSRRFHDLVGEPPMTFLTGWRLALAADLLCEPDATVGSVADKVGYSSPFALSTAFKRVRGLSPQEHRARALSSDGAPRAGTGRSRDRRPRGLDTDAGRTEGAALKPRSTRRSSPRRWIRVLRRVRLVALLLVGVYVAIVLVGLIPVNNGFQPDAGGIEITVVSTAVHADVVLPIATDAIDWREHFPSRSFQRDTAGATHVAIGWGDRGFYLETPTWADLKFSTAARALLLPSKACMHVSMIRGSYSADGARRVTISRQQHTALVEFIVRNFLRDESGRVVPIENFSYGTNDAFFEARGSYNLVNTCNSWVGRALQSAGVRTPWLTPLPKTVFLYFPD